MKHLPAIVVLVIGFTAFAGAQSMMKSAPADAATGVGAMTASPALTGTELRLAKAVNKYQFTDLESAMALASKGPTVLFFAADWCPTCKDALKDLNANGASLGKISVVVVDYDASRALKARYGVSYQHTFVQIDAAGKAIAIWNGGGVNQILARAVAGK